MSDDQQLETIPTPTLRMESHYKMNHPKRGIAVIFDHEYYRNNYVNRRNGTNIDRRTLTNCLENLGFEVKEYQNLNSEKIQKKLKKVSEMDHTDHDCLVVAILTHGTTGKLCAHDKAYETDTIWPYFTDEKCQTLAGKPKIFFIQACQGDKLDHGISLRERTQTDDSRSVCGLFHRDFLIAYATVPGYYAWKNEAKGSYFIQALCAELNENGKEFDLLTLLTFVNLRVAIDFESNVPTHAEKHRKKQVPCITSLLRRVVQF